MDEFKAVKFFKEFENEDKKDIRCKALRYLGMGRTHSGLRITTSLLFLYVRTTYFLKINFGVCVGRSANPGGIEF